MKSPETVTKGKEPMNIEQEGRMRYKILTNFVNAYKDKMFLSSSPSKGKDDMGSGDIMTLEDLKAQSQAEKSDIKLDFEQFMRIYNFEKNRSISVPQNVTSPNRTIGLTSPAKAAISSPQKSKDHPKSTLNSNA